MLKGKTKEIILKIHLWLGIVTAIPILILSLTGSVLVFQDEIEGYLNNSITKLKNPSDKVELNAIIKNFNNSYPIAPGRISIPSESDQAVRVFAMNRRKGVRIDAYFDRATGSELGQKNATAQGFFSFMLRLHRGMIAGDTGKFILTYSTGILLLLLISGMILWLPSKLKLIKKSLQINLKARLKALLYQMHTTIGVFSMIFLLVIAFSGFYMGDRSFQNLVQISLGGDQLESRGGHGHGTSNNARKQKKSKKNQRNKKVDYNDFINTIHNNIVYDADIMVAFGRRADDPVRFIATENTGFAAKKATFTFKDNNLQKVEHSSEMETADFYRSINRSVHTGDYFGLGGKLLFFLSCLACASLVITGVWLWLSKKQKKRKRVFNSVNSVA